MAYFEEDSEAMIALEAMVDSAGLANVCYALEHICYAKAAHLRETWQDKQSAKYWDREARQMQRRAYDVALPSEVQPVISGGMYE